MSRPLLLAVATVSPWPAGNGYALRVNHLLRQLTRDWDVLLLAPRGTAAPDPGPEALEWQALPWRPDWGHLPDEYDTEQVIARIERAIAERRPDALLFWGSTAALASRLASLPPSVNDKIDCMTLHAWRNLRSRRGLRPRIRQLGEILRYGRFERRAARSVQYAVVVGEDDARALQRISGRAVYVVPNGVELGAGAATTDEADTPTILFTGVLRFGPNVDAVRFFVEQVWPAVRVAEPGARFVVAGRNPEAAVLVFDGRNGVEVRANVPDLGEEIRQAWVAVAPMVSGSGIKNKVLEAWAEGRPVVMTRLAANGLRIGEQMAGLVAERPQRMAELLIELLRDPVRRRALGKAAFERAASHHSWDSAAAELSHLLNAAIARDTGR